MEFQSVQYTIDKLVQWIRTGSLALPDFQRDFVWNPSRVVELLDTVAKQWPIGSLLLLSGPQPFGVRAIQSAPPAKEAQLDLYVLDGQQRITSLYHAISDVSDYCYYINFAALETGDDDYLGWERRKKFQRAYPDLAERAKRHIALVSDVWDLDTFYEWLDHLGSAELRRSYVRLRETRLAGLQAKVYKVMGIQLDQEIQLEALARIFETLNRTGVKLNAFDLLVAIMYPTGFNLREEWESARAENDLIDAFSVDPLEIMKVASLLIRKEQGKAAAKGVRQGDLLALNKDFIRSYWTRAVEVYERTLLYAKGRLGVFSPEVVPAWSMMLGLSTWHLSNGPAVTEADINRWFWGSAFGQTYAQGANTRVIRDFDLIAEGDFRNLLREFSTIDVSVFSQPARPNGLAMRAFGCLVSQLGGVDPISGEPIKNSGGIAFKKLEQGTLKKVASSDSFGSLVIVSKKSDRALAKAHGCPRSLDVSSGDFRERLLTQHLDADLEGRHSSDFARMIDLALGGAS